MALIVEDGSVVANADSYYTLETAKAYAEKYGLDFPTEGSAEIVAAAEAAARRGSSYVDARFRSRFPGQRVDGRGQSFEFPRKNATDIYGTAIPSDEIPLEVIYAAIEAGAREVANPGSLSPDVTTGTIKKRVKVDTVEVEYAGNGDVASQRPVISVLTDILYPILTTETAFGSGFAEAVRI